MAGKGAPKGNHYSETHGIVTLRNQIKRRTKRGRSFIDMRSHSGQNAVAVQSGLIDDLGGANHVTTAEKVLVELVGRDLYLLDEVDQRIIKLCRKHPAAKNNPAAVSKLYSYRVPIVNNLTRSLSALGLARKEVAPKSLEDIFNEPGDADTEEE
jgi:hypothetical protein